MVSIDERIKRELEETNAELADVMDDKALMSDMVTDAFKGSVGRMMIVALSISILLTVVFVWSVVEFVTADTIQDSIFWAVWTILSAVVVMVFELWAWMQINRVSLRREIKQIELSLRHAIENKSD